MSKPQVFPYDFETSKKFCNIFDERKHKEKLRLVQPVLFSSTCLPGELPPSTGGTCDSHRGRRAVSLRMSLEKHVGDNDGASEGRGREREKRREKRKKVPEGFWGPAKQLNGCKQHRRPHVQAFKISARVMGSAWPLSGCMSTGAHFPVQFTGMGGRGPMPKNRQDLTFFLPYHKDFVQQLTRGVF